MKTRCINCGNHAAHSHHVVPRSLGGNATVSLCEECHGKAHGKTSGFRRTGELARAALAEKKARGEACGQVPYGYSLAEGKLVENAAEMELIALVKHLRGAGKSLRAIVEYLASSSHKTRDGGKITLTQVVRILRWKPIEVTGSAEPYRRRRRSLGFAQLSLFGNTEVP